MSTWMAPLPDSVPRHIIQLRNGASAAPDERAFHRKIRCFCPEDPGDPNATRSRPARQVRRALSWSWMVSTQRMLPRDAMLAKAVYRTSSVLLYRRLDRPGRAAKLPFMRSISTCAQLSHLKAGKCAWGTNFCCNGGSVTPRGCHTQVEVLELSRPLLPPSHQPLSAWLAGD